MAYTTWITANPLVNVTQVFGGSHRGKDWNTRDASGVMGDTMVRAIGDGEVIRSEYGTGGNWSWGNFIAIYYPALDRTVLTAHHAERLVKVGDSVSAGTPIGNFGMTGNTTGPHCHEEWHVGRGITNNLVTPEDGFPNIVGRYEVEYGGGEPPMPGEFTANMLIVVFAENGHTINSPASNDPENYVYFGNKRKFRVKPDDLNKVQEFGSWNYWQDITDVAVLKIFNKDLSDLPNV